MLKVRVEKLLEGRNAAGERVNVHAGSYEQTVTMKGEDEVRLLKRIIAEVNNIKIK